MKFKITQSDKTASKVIQPEALAPIIIDIDYCNLETNVQKNIEITFIF